MNKKLLKEFLENVDGVVFNGLFNRWDDAKGIATDTANEVSKFTEHGKTLVVQMAKDHLRTKGYTVDYMTDYDLLYHHQLELTFQNACWNWAEEIKDD